jgi:hypothetical protein
MVSLQQPPTVLHHRAHALDAAWFLAREGGLLGALLRRTIRLRGDPRLLLAFGRCFPS